MPTENNIKFGDGRLLLKTNNSEIMQELMGYEYKEENNDDKADAMRYYAESLQNGVTFTIDKASARRLYKMVGLETITRKRFKKLLMSCGLQRNDAEIIAETFHNNKIRYTPLAVQNVIETIIKEAEKEEEM